MIRGAEYCDDNSAGGVVHSAWLPWTALADVTAGDHGDPGCRRRYARGRRLRCSQSLSMARPTRCPRALQLGSNSRWIGWINLVRGSCREHTWAG